MHSPERRVAVDAARAAGHLLTRELDGVRRIAYKGSPTNLVTEMDAQCEALIVDRLRSAFASDAILSEEAGGKARPPGRPPSARSPGRGAEQTPPPPGSPGSP